MKTLATMLWLLCVGLSIQGTGATPSLCNCKNRTDVRVALVTYGDHTSSGTFNQIRQGFLESSKLLRIQALPMQGTPSQLISSLGDVDKVVLDNLDEVLALDPPVNAIILGLSNLATLSEPLKTRLASRQDLVVVTLGADGNEYATLDRYNTTTYLPMIHVGVNHRDVGVTSGVQACRGGAKNALCVVHLLGDSTFSNLCAGFEFGFKSVCPNSQVSTIYAPLSNEFTAKDAIRTTLEGDSEINTVVTSNGAMAKIAHDLGSGIGRDQMLIISMIADEVSKDLLSSGDIKLAIEHKDYLSSFFATVLATHAAVTTMSPINMFLNSGFKVLSAAPETHIGKPVSQIRIEQIVHGLGVDGFWKVYKDGAAEAARDVGIQFVDCSQDAESCLLPGTLTYRAPLSEFDLTSMAAMIDLAASTDPDAMLMSLPNYEALGHAVEHAASNLGIFSVCVNYMDRGLNVIPGLNHLVAQDDNLAGYESGRLLARNGAKKVVCINPEQGNEGWNSKCLLAIEGVADYNGVDKSAAGSVVVASHGDSLLLQQILVPLFEGDSEYNGVISNPATTLAGRAVLDGTSSLADRVIHYGTHDITSDSLAGLSENKLLFAVEQQQNLQGYYSVWLAALEAFSGQTFETPWLLTGPKAATPATMAATLCRDVPTCTPEEEFLGMNTNSECLRPDWVGDGWCDAVNNKASCDFDGGDCCPETCQGGWYSCGNDTHSVGHNTYSCLDITTHTGLSRFCDENPEDVLCIRDDLQRLSSTERYILIALGSLALAACVITGLLIAKESSRIIFFAKKGVLLTNTVGIMLIISQSMVAATSEHVPLVCAAEDWLFQIGYCLLFFPIFAKMGTIIRIFGNKSLSVVKPRPNEVMYITAFGIVVCSVLVVVSQTAISPYALELRFVNECITDEQYRSSEIVSKVLLTAFNLFVLMICYHRVLKLEREVPTTFVLLQNDLTVTKLLVYHTATIGPVAYLLMQFLLDTLPRRRHLFLQNIILLYFATFAVVVNNIYRLRECYKGSVSKISFLSGLLGSSTSGTRLSRIATDNGNATTELHGTLNSNATTGAVGVSIPALESGAAVNLEDRLKVANEALQRATIKLNTAEKAFKEAENAKNLIFSQIVAIKSEMLFKQNK